MRFNIALLAPDMPECLYMLAQTVLCVIATCNYNGTKNYLSIVAVVGSLESIVILNANFTVLEKYAIKFSEFF